MRLRLIRLCLWGSVLTFTGAGQTPDSIPKEPCFSAIVSDAGWKIPEHGPAIETGPFKAYRAPEGITFTRFKVHEQFALPRYYIEEKKLVLFSLFFNTDHIERLEIDGIPFGFFATVKGVQVGFAGDVWWLDRDGDGKFEEFQWGPDFGKLPDWVMKRLAAKSRP